MVPRQLMHAQLRSTVVEEPPHVQAQNYPKPIIGAHTFVRSFDRRMRPRVSEYLGHYSPLRSNDSSRVGHRWGRLERTS